MKNNLIEPLKEWNNELLNDELNVHDLLLEGKINNLVENIIDAKNSASEKKRYVELCEMLLGLSEEPLNEFIDRFLFFIAQNATSRKELVNVFFNNYLNRYLSDGNFSFNNFLFYYLKTINLNPYGYNQIENKFIMFKFNEHTISVLTEKFDGKAELDVLLGYRNLSLNNIEEAINSFIKATDKDNRCAPAYFEIARYYFLQDIWDNALSFYHKFIEFIGPPNEFNSEVIITVFEEMAYCYTKIKVYDDAEKYYKKAIDINADNLDLKNDLAYCLYLQGKYEEGLKYINQSIQEKDDDDTDLTAYWHKIKILNKLKRYHESLNLLESMKKIARGQKAIHKEIDKIQQKIESLQKTKETKTGNDHLESQIDEMIPQQEAHLDIAPYENTKEPSQLSKHEIEIKKEKWLEEQIYSRMINGDITLGKKLFPYKDEKNKYGGRQFPTPIGRIDLIALDESEDIVIIELKKGKSDRDVFGQTSSYIGWAKDNLAKPGQKVLGIICVYVADEKLKSAISSNNNITLYEYKYNPMLS